MLLWAAFSEQWALNQPITFDGINRKIYVAPSIGTLNVRQDIYSNWKEWVRLYDNAKYLPALRTIGGDPIGGGETAGDLYFLQNGWKIEVNHYIEIQGAIYSDDGNSPFIILEGGGIRSTVSSLVQNLGFTGTVANTVVVEPNILPEDVWNYLLVNANTPGSVGERFKSLLTVAKYLGLK